MERPAERPQARAAAAGEDHRHDAGRLLAHGGEPPWSARSLRSAEICDLKGDVLAFLAREKRLRQLQAVADACRCQHVEVAELAVAALEVLRLDPALGEQRLQHVMRLAEADAELARELPLRVLGVLLEQAQQGDGGVFVGGGGVRVQRAGVFNG